jgi:hypothetical protein
MVEADDNLQKHIITTVENGILVISCETYFINTEVMKVTVKMPVIEQLEASSDASITSKNYKRREYSTKHIKCCDNRSHYRGG